MRNCEKWDGRFMSIAKGVSTWSKDPQARVGAILVSPDGRQVSWGYNGLPSGIADDDHRLQDTEVKLSMVVDAELNAILNCPVRPEGWTMFSTKYPCSQCAAAIIQSGISRVVAARFSTVAGSSKWLQSQILARDMFHEAGIEVKSVR